MSRFEKMPLKIKDGVEIRLSDGKVCVKGKNGENEFVIPKEVDVKKEDEVLRVKPKTGASKEKSFVGLTWRLIENMMIGVTDGFSKELVLTGVGYRMNLKGNTINFQLGFSHDVSYPLPEGVKAEIDPKANSIKISGHDKQLVGSVADKIKMFRPIEPYKGKGFKFKDEYVIRKAGKTNA